MRLFTMIASIRSSVVFLCGVLVWITAPYAQISKQSTKQEKLTTEVQWLPQAFQETTSLPLRFLGTDSKKFGELFSKKLAALKKGEFETTAEFARRTADSASNLFPIRVDVNYAFRVDDIRFSYDADKRKYLPTKGSGLCSSIPQGLPDAGSIVCSVGRTFTYQDAYEGTNAFGAKAKVNRTTMRFFGLALSPDFVKANPSVFSDYSKSGRLFDFVGAFDVPIEKARTLGGKTLSALFIGQIASAKLVKRYQRVEPKIDNPIEVNIEVEAVPFTLRRILYYVEETGEILRKVELETVDSHSRSGAATPDTQVTMLSPNIKTVSANERYSNELKTLITAAEVGDAKSQGLLGKTYYEGKIISKDVDKAFLWFKKAADQGDPVGINGLGLSFASGKTVPKDEVKAIAYFQKAADLGYFPALMNLGNSYLTGAGVAKDTAKGIAFFQQAADLGLPKANVVLGTYYITGTNVPKDATKGVELIKKASDLGDETAQYILGTAHLDGEFGFKKDSSQAIDLITKSAEAGNASAQMRLGIMYQTGANVDKDYSKALQWTRKAAEQENAPAQNNLAILYANGYGVQRNYKEAFKWTTKAAENGSKESMTYLVKIYEEGLLDIPRDSSKAEYWKKRLVTVSATTTQITP